MPGWIRGFIFILDATDESDGSDRHEILNAMMMLCSGTSQGVVKGLVKARPLSKKDLGKQIDEFPSLILQDRNRNDIAEIVEREIARIMVVVTREDGMIEATIFDGIKNHIQSNANGVFLWVILVLKEVEKLSDEGFSSRNDLRLLYTILPVVLEVLYKRMIDRLVTNLSGAQIKEGKKLLLLAIFSLRRLTVDEIRDAIVVPSVLDIEHFEPSSDCLYGRIQLLERRIQLVCGDLLEIKNPFVQMVHESVRNFLLREDKIAGEFSTHKQKVRAEIASICIRYLRLK